MKLPIVAVSEIISGANFLWLDKAHIYLGKALPAGADKTGKATNVLIQDAPSMLTGHKNNVTSMINAEVEVQIFFSTKVKVNILDAKVAVMNELQDHDWKISNIYPDSEDPDTQQKTATFYVEKRIGIRGND